MILFTLEHRHKSRLLWYSVISVFCLILFIVYNIFSHEVYSNYMTFLFAWPLVLGLIPSLFLAFIPRLREPSELTKALYHAGLASVTVSSLLKGIFEIAGTSSMYQLYLMIFGAVLLVAGIINYIFHFK